MLLAFHCKTMDANHGQVEAILVKWAVNESGVPIMQTKRAVRMAVPPASFDTALGSLSRFFERPVNSQIVPALLNGATLEELLGNRLPPEEAKQLLRPTFTSTLFHLLAYRSTSSPDNIRKQLDWACRMAEL